jgi:hypothetical protein
MTDPDDPSRLFDSPSEPAGLRDVLRAASKDVGTDAQVARLAQRLGPLLGPVGPAAPVAAASKALGLKLALAGAALIAAGGGAWLLATPSARPPSAPTQAPVPPSPKPQPAAVTTPEAPVAPPEVTATPDGAPSADEAAKAAAPGPAKLPGKPTPPAQPSEAELLEQARAALKADPARALQRANEHAARYPRGVLVQEREVLAIQALRKLGRSAEADRRTEAFAKAFPGSAFARKLAAPQ